MNSIMKISRIFILGLSLAAFASCSQEADFEEEYKEIGEIIPFKFSVQFAESTQENSHRKIRANGHDSKWAYYKWKVGDRLAVVLPDAPQDYEGVDYTRGVYEVTKATVFASWATTEELNKVYGNLGFATANADKIYRIYYAYPADKVNVKQYHSYIPKSGTTNEQLSADFEVTIEAVQNGTVETFDPGVGEDEATVDYQVGDWSQAVCGGAMGRTPNQMITGSEPLLMWPMFTAAECDIEAPEGGCTIKSIELTAHPIMPSIGEVKTDICGKASGTFTCIGGGELEFSPFVTEHFTGSNDSQDKLTLNITGMNGEAGQQLEAGKKLRASLFFFPCGNSTISSGRDVVPMNLQVKITYSTTSGDITKTASFSSVNVRLGGRNHINIGKLPTE